MAKHNNNFPMLSHGARGAQFPFTIMKLPMVRIQNENRAENEQESEQEIKKESVELNAEHKFTHTHSLR
jgi:hypothetical protein